MINAHYNYWHNTLLEVLILNPLCDSCVFAKCGKTVHIAVQGLQMNILRYIVTL